MSSCTMIASIATLLAFVHKNYPLFKGSMIMKTRAFVTTFFKAMKFA